MKLILIKGFFVTGAVSVLIAQPPWGQVVRAMEVQRKPTDISAQQPSSNIPYLSEIKFPLTSAKWLRQEPRQAIANSSAVAQVQESVVQVTGVRLNPTPRGLEVILDTADGRLPQVLTSSNGQTLLIDLSNARLNLPQGKEFRADNPAEGITAVTVTPLSTNSVRVSAIGKAAVPTVEVVQSDASGGLRQGGLVLRLSPAASTTTAMPTPTPQTSDSKPSESIQPDKPPAAQQPKPPGKEEEIEIVVTGDREREEGYRVPNASTATRTDTPLRDIPQSIQVIPRQVIEDQQVVELPEAVRNVSGVVRTYGYAGSTDNYTIRGLTADFNLRNGFRDRGFYSYTDPANIERVEVLKGPASVLYGQFEPGGVVNYITKQPLSEPYYAAQFRVGSYNYYRPSIDFSGPLNSDRTLLYRLNLAYENSGSFRDFVDKELFVVAPVLRYQLGDATALTLEYEYLNLNRTFDRGFPPLRESFELPISRYLGEPSDRYDFNSHKVNLSLDHRFSENWRFRSAFSSGLLESLRSNVQGSPFTLERDGRTLRRVFTLVDDYTQSYALQNDLIGQFNTGSVNHQLLFGFELSRNIYGYTFRRAPFPSIDIFNPVYGFPLPTTFNSVFGSDQTTDNVGIYLQDQVALLPNLKLLVGGRFDIINYDSEDFTSGEAPTKSSRYYEAFSPRIGLVYQPIQPISLYASYTRSFKPNFSALTANRQPLEPERGRQYEVGVKAELLDGKLSTTLAAYEITKSNVATPDPNNIDFSIAAGEVKSRGIELDVTGEILPGWNVIASYAYNNAFVSKDNNIPEGSRLVNAPYNSASLWTTYEIQRGNLRGLGFGAGMFFVGDREAELPNTITIPSYIRTDATIFYRRDKYRISLNVQNLFDVKYYNSQGFLLYPGEPLTVYGSIGVEF
ncbi:MAG TPA: TonB-dependent siderophore receptor [Coleofasciculaceae cyanobacterium]